MELSLENQDGEGTNYPLTITPESGAQAGPKYSEKDAESKSARVIYSMSGDERMRLPPEAVKTSIMQGDEESIAKFLATEEQIKQNNRKRQIMEDLSVAKASQGGNYALTEQERAIIKGLSKEELVDPGSILEKRFAEVATNQALALSGKVWEDAQNENLDQADELANHTQETLTKQEIARTVLEKARKRVEEQSWGGYIADFGKNFFPLYDTLKFRNRIGKGGFLKGQSLEDQASNLWAIGDPGEFKKALESAYEDIAADNPQAAEEFVQYVITGVTGGEKFFNNLITGLDVTDLSVIAKGVGRTVKGAAKSGTAMQTLAKTTKYVRDVMAKRVVDPSDVATVVGAEVDAATLKAMKIVDLSEAISATGKGDAADVGNLIRKSAPSLGDPLKVFDTTAPTQITNTLAARLVEQHNFAVAAAKRILSDVNTVARLDETSRAATRGFREALERVSDVYSPAVRNAVLDAHTRFVYGSDTISNVNHVEVAIGATNGQLFASQKQAQIAMEKFYRIPPEKIDRYESVGGKWFAVVKQNVDETTRGVRDIVIDADNKTPIKPFGVITNKVLSADNVVSKSNTIARKTATNSSEEVQRLYKIMAEPISQLSKAERERVTRILEQNRDMPHPVTGDRGYYYKTVNEFDTAFVSMHNRPPSPKEREAYFAARRLNDLDYVIRNLNLYRNRASSGWMDVQFQIGDKLTPKIHGKIYDDIPWDDGHEGKVLVLDGKNPPKILSKTQMSAAEKDAIKESVKKKNRQVIMLTQPMRREIEASLPPELLGAEPINFVVTARPKISKLDIQQIPYKEGGHVVYDNQWFIKNANVYGSQVGKVYGGDLTFSGHVTEKEARDLLPIMEKGRQLYLDEQKSKYPQLLNDFVTNNLPMSPKQFRAMFKSGLLNPNGEFFVTKSGMSYDKIKDLKSMGLRDLTKSPYNLEDELDKAFTSQKGEESLYSFHKGSAGNPVWKMETARTLNPVDSLNKGLRDALRSRFYNDYIMKSANQFVEQWKHLMLPSEDTLRSNPLYWLYHPSWKTDRQVMNVDELSQAKAFRDAVINLIETPTPVRASWDVVRNRVMNFAYEKWGNDAAQWLDESAVFKTRDPIRFLRSIAFHTKIGLFNPVQFFLNTQTMFHAAAISPQHAVPAFKDAMILWYARGNTGSVEVYKHLAKKSSYKYFDELTGIVDRSGWANVGGSVAGLDDFLEPKVVQSTFGKFLDAGTMFFKNAEQMVRLNAMAIAHREWRAANPTAKLDKMIERQILNRADNLTVNMTRASNAAYNNGFLSVPAQFTSYAMRMSEQLLEGAFSGKGALTRAETGRVMLMYSALYGIPSAGAAALGIWPLQQSFEEYAMSKGIDLDGNLMAKTLSRGVLNTAYDLITGENTNLNERYGPNGLSLFKEILSGDKSVVDFFLGASGSVIAKGLQATYPLGVALANVFSEDQNAFPLAPEDFLDAFRSVSSIDQVTKAYLGAKYGLWLTKNEIQVTEVSSVDAVNMTILGLTPREATETFLAKKTLREKGKLQDEVQKLVTMELHRAFRAVSDGDQKSADRFFKRAAVWVNTADLTQVQKNALFAKALGTYGNDVDEVNAKMIRGATTPEEVQARIDRATRIQSERNARKQ